MTDLQRKIGDARRAIAHHREGIRQVHDILEVSGFLELEAREPFYRELSARQNACVELARHLELSELRAEQETR
jgi:hypothetical protein